MLIALVAVVVVVLGGIGVLVGNAMQSNDKPGAAPVNPTPTSPPNTAPPNTSPPGTRPGGGGTSTTSTSTSTTQPPNGNGGGGTGVKLGNGLLVVPVPSGWDSKVADDGSYVVVSKDNVAAYVDFGKTSGDATATVTAMLQGFVTNNDSLSQVQTGQVETVDVKDPLSSGADIAYLGLYTSSNGSANEYGILFAFVRTDGTAIRLQLVAFGSSADDAQNAFKASLDDLKAILNGAVNSFAQSAT
ncbi:MAG TPA: hypothetical protein VEP49_09600 [Acidimicrobiia bacterium]|nr:hypothetical protein [Acidimicrobiia bacterium]